MVAIGVRNVGGSATNLQLTSDESILHDYGGKRAVE